MIFEKDNKAFNRAVRSYFDKVEILKSQGDSIRNICLKSDDGNMIGGVAFTPVSENGITWCYLLMFDKSWATKEAYSKIISFPFTELGAEYVYGVLTNEQSRKIALSNGGKLLDDGVTVVFNKEDSLKIAENPNVQ